MRFSTHPTPPARRARHLALFGLIATTLALGACSREETAAAEKKVDAAVTSAERKVDGAMAQAEQKIDQASVKAEQKADELKVDAQRSMEQVKEASSQAADKLGKKVNDAAITTAMNAELAKDPTLSALSINVDTTNGNVLLRGTAPDSAARQRATDLAAAVPGVSAVDNQLAVKP